MKSKECSQEGCSKPIFASKLCRMHQHLRTDLKSLGLAKKGIRKQSKVMIDKIPVKKIESHKQMLFFQEIFDERPHICGNCGCPLGDEARSYHFDHLLEKENYPKLKYVKENILLVCLGCHSDKTLGHPGVKHQIAITLAKSLLK